MARSASGLTLRLVLPAKSLRCQGVGAGGIVGEIGIPGLVLECGFQLLERLVRPLAQLRGHDDRQIELGARTESALLELARSARPPPCDRAGHGRWTGY